MTFIAEF